MNTEHTDINQFKIPEEFRHQFQPRPESPNNDGPEQVGDTVNPEASEGQAEQEQEGRDPIRDLGNLASSQELSGSDNHTEQTTAVSDETYGDTGQEQQEVSERAIAIGEKLDDYRRGVLEGAR